MPLAGDKMEGPTRCLTFWGIELDTVVLTSRLTLAKLDDLRGRLVSFLGARKATLHEFQVLLGHLNFACKVAPGWAFLCRLCDATKGASNSHHWMRVTLDMKEDLSVWLIFLAEFNGVAFWRIVLCLESELQVHWDAAGSLGMEVYFQGHWCAEEWPPQWVEKGWTQDLTFL